MLVEWPSLMSPQYFVPAAALALGAGSLAIGLLASLKLHTWDTWTVRVFIGAGALCALFILLNVAVLLFGAGGLGNLLLLWYFPLTFLASIGIASPFLFVAAVRDVHYLKERTAR